METLSNIAYDLTPIIQAFIALAAAVCSCFLIPYIKGKLSVDQLKILENWIKIAVAAAEQTFAGGGTGTVKKQYAFDLVKKNDYAIDDEKLGAMIESAVFEMNNKK